MKICAGFWLAAVVGLGCSAAWGQDVAVSKAKRPKTFKDLQAMKRVSDPQISSSGKWVLFSVTEVNLEKNTGIAIANS
jgi:hypothetical protein